MRPSIPPLAKTASKPFATVEVPTTLLESDVTLIVDGDGSSRVQCRDLFKTSNNPALLATLVELLVSELGIKGLPEPSEPGLFALQSENAELREKLENLPAIEASLAAAVSSLVESTRKCDALAELGDELNARIIELGSENASLAGELAELRRASDTEPPDAPATEPENPLP